MNAQAELIRKQRELDDAKREMELTVEKRVEESLGGVRHKAKQEAEDAFKLKLLEKEQLIASMQRQVEELKRKSEQGSQQLQGEVQEIELESLLRSKFPSDARAAGAGQQTKKELVYRYLTGPLFRQRIEAIAEKVSDMQADLAKERKNMNRLWAKRESQIIGVIESTFGMYGDLQGIAGTALQEIDRLDGRLLESTSYGEQIETKTEEEAIESGSFERHPLASKEGNGGF